MSLDDYDKLLALPVRKHPHHGAAPSKWATDPIFITVCTRNRRPFLTNDHVHQTLRRLWSDRSHWIVGPYVLMPEHLHLLAVEASTNKIKLSSWVGWWKHQSASRLGTLSLRWQKGYWDTRVRNQAMLSEKMRYIRDNPIKRGLVPQSDQWIFQGEMWTISSL